MRVLAIDPGAKTGVALFDANTLKAELLLIIPNGLPGLQEWFSQETVEGPSWDVIVVESFELEEGSHGIDLTPVGIIDWFKSKPGWPIVWQRRNQRGKGKLISVPVLKRAGLYPKRGELREGHQVAALQHALAYLVRQRHLPTMKLLFPREEIEP